MTKAALLGLTNERPSTLRRRNLIVAAGLGAMGMSWAQIEKPFTDLLVVVPGIMGSTLYRNGKLVWGLAPEAFVPILKAGNLDLANLRDSSSAAPVTVGKVFDSVTIIPGFWKLDGYTELRAGLTEQLGAQPGENYFEFAYDWRQDNRISAAQLYDQCRVWLSAWRQKSNNIEARVVLVCHSMGGLVARYAAEVLGANEIFQTIFSLGTPYQGSCAALSRIANGLLTPGLTQTVASFDSVYQLLPTYPCIESGAGVIPLSQSSWPSDGLLDPKRVKEIGLSFHDECNAAANKRKQAGGKGVALHVIQSSTHKTGTRGWWNGSKLAAIDNIQGIPTMGDGTVPGYALAQPVGGTNPVSIMHCNQLHGAIQNYGAAIDHIVGTLKTGTASVKRSQRAVSMRCDDIVKVGEDCLTRLEFQVPPIRDAKLSLVDTTLNTEVASVMLPNNVGQTAFDLNLKIQNAGIYRIIFLEHGQPVCSDLVAAV